MSDPVAASAAPFDMPPPGAGFDKRAGWLVNRLVADLKLSPAQAAGIVGNLGGESGLQAIQERHPLAGLGGFGWEQATGSRRTAFYKYAADNNLSVTDDRANYGFLLAELNGSEAHALEQLRKTTTLEAATYTFCVDFERPSDPSGTMPDRLAFAKRALAASVGIEAPSAPDPDHSADALNAAELAAIKAGEPAPAAVEPQPPAPLLKPIHATIAAGGIATAVVGILTWIASMKGIAVPETVQADFVVLVTWAGAVLLHR